MASRKRFTLRCPALKIMYEGTLAFIWSTYSDRVPTAQTLHAMKKGETLTRRWRYSETSQRTHVWKFERVK